MNLHERNRRVTLLRYVLSKNNTNVLAAIDSLQNAKSLMQVCVEQEPEDCKMVLEDSYKWNSPVVLQVSKLKGVIEWRPQS